MIQNLKNLQFNKAKPTVIHIDVNSCFATIEQQANPLIRGKLVAVAARDTKHATIVAASIEAKKWDIKTGTRVSEAKQIYPKIIILTPDPPKYRYVHQQMQKIIKDYTPKFDSRSIDEFVLHLEEFHNLNLSPFEVGQVIKKRIRNEIGEYITVSVGIGANRFLAKTAAGVVKPDGLVEINYSNYKQIYSSLTLPNLYGINVRNTARLSSVGIHNPLDFCNASQLQLKAAFKSVLAYYWYLKLRGYEIDDFKTKRRTFGHSYVLSKPTTNQTKLTSVLQKLVEKLGHKMRKKGFKARGIHIGVLFDNKTYWHEGHKLQKELYDSQDIYKYAFGLFQKAPKDEKIKRLSVTCFHLDKTDALQLELFEDIVKVHSRVNAVDTINKRYGKYTISPARMINTKKHVYDAIAFGR